MYWKNVKAVPSTLSLPSAARRLLRDEDRVVDLGCGAGGVLRELRDNGLGRRHVGADINISSLTRAGLLGLPVVQADLAALPFVDGAFDVGVLHAVLTTLADPPGRLRVLGEARRVVGRALFLADFLQNWDLPYYRARYETGMAEVGEKGSFLVREGGQVLYQAHHFTLDELTALLGQAGFSVTDVATPTVRTRSGNAVRGVTLTAVPLGH